MNKKIKIGMVFFLIVLIGAFMLVFYQKDDEELKSIKSEKQLLGFYEGSNYSTVKEVITNILCMPFTMGEWMLRGTNGILAYESVKDSALDYSINSSSVTKGVSIAEDVADLGTAQSSSSSKDYSTTNIQVENVDEADITKTDGDYIYSISENKVVITDVRDPKNISIATTISDPNGSIPEDLMLYKNKLAIISTKTTNSSSSYYYRYSSNNNTVVKIYDITTKSTPVLVKSYELYEPYYTSRCINNMLYIIASGSLRQEENDSKRILRNYKEDNIEEEIALQDIKYMKDVRTSMQTLISVVDLDNPRADISLSSYLMDISNAYVSEKSIYLLDQDYEYDTYNLSIKSLFGLKGVIGFFEHLYDYDNYDSGYETEIYKFNIEKDGEVSYSAKNKIKGRTINQYSLDEQNGHLRVALYDDDGTRVAIFDKNLDKVGVSKNIAKGERMYSSRFIGNKVYLVTYKTMDPLFVIDLSDEENPRILGELKIPGYSTYLHPYDENHLIGIGMETEEVVNRNSLGKVISTSDKIIGMKMALFDVSDVNNPIQMSQTVIGDSRTTSAILTNPKALLFSKERQLIAIPVNNYSEDFEIDNTSDTYSSIISSYTNYNKNYVAEGYWVYKINLDDGFNLKGIITHEKTDKKKDSLYYYYYNYSKLLRGMYIDQNLYTVSEEAIMVNNLDTLELVDELKIRED